MTGQMITLHVEYGVSAEGSPRWREMRFNPDHIVSYIAQFNSKDEPSGTNLTTILPSLHTVQESPEEIDHRLYGLIDRDGGGAPLVAVREARAL